MIEKESAGLVSESGIGKRTFDEKSNTHFQN